MQTILIDARAISDPQSGGVNRAAKYWINGISKDRNNRYICVTTGIKLSYEVSDFCKKNNFEYYHIKIPNKLWTIFAIFSLTSIQKKTEEKYGPIDLVLLPNIGFVGKINKPYHLLLHDCSFAIEPRWFNWKRRIWHKIVPIKKLIENAQQIDCVSNQTKQDAIRLYNQPENKFSLFPTMYNGIKENYASKPFWLPQTTTRFVLLLGGTDPRKNIITALKAINSYNIQFPNRILTPVILGGRPFCPLGQNTTSYILAPKHIPDKELVYLYGQTIALLYPSWYEGFGLPLQEINHFNKPIIASTAGALPETAPKNTIFCHPAKPHEWLTAIKLLTLE